MKYAFTKMRLEAPSLYKLIMKWVETQLVVTETDARIIGYGYYYEIAGAFSHLVLDWEATIPIPNPGLGPGEYELDRLDGTRLSGPKPEGKGRDGTEEHQHSRKSV